MALSTQAARQIAFSGDFVLDETVHMAQPAKERAGPLQVVVFTIEGKSLAVDILKVQEILRMLEITPMPKMPEFALGMINLRGRLVPILDIRHRLNLPPRRPGPRTCIVLVMACERLLGFLVDEVSEVIDLPETAVETPDSGPEWLGEELFAGVGKLPGRIVVLLNPDGLLSPHEVHLLMQDSRRTPHSGEGG